MKIDPIFQRRQEHKKYCTEPGMIGGKLRLPASSIRLSLAASPHRQRLAPFGRIISPHLRALWRLPRAVTGRTGNFAVVGSTRRSPIEHCTGVGTVVLCLFCPGSKFRTRYHQLTTTVGMPFWYSSTANPTATTTMMLADEQYQYQTVNYIQASEVDPSPTRSFPST